MEERILRERYRIVAPIGEGGMGAVLLADDLRLPGRRCAIKEVGLPAGGDERLRADLEARFAAEAAVLARLDHPAIPAVSDHFRVGERAYLVMDFVPGQDLRAVLQSAIAKGRRLDCAQVTGWLEEVCAALSYLHAQSPPVVHGDVKPANIKLTPDGQVRLVDFGLARPIGAAEGATATVTVLSGAGSRPYQPLEQYGDAEAVDARSDVYALGATAYHLLAGRAPASARERFLDEGALAGLAEVRPGVPARVVVAVEAAMALHPDARPATAETLRGMLVGPAVGEGGGRDAAGWPEAARRNIRWIALFVALVVGAVATTVF